MFFLDLILVPLPLSFVSTLFLLFSDLLMSKALSSPLSSILCLTPPLEVLVLKRVQIARLRILGVTIILTHVLLEILA